MARVTVEDCLKNVKNRFELVVLAAKRARQLMRGKEPKVEWDNDKPTVVALREIAAGYTDIDSHDHHDHHAHPHEEQIVIIQAEEEDDEGDITMMAEETTIEEASDSDESEAGDHEESHSEEDDNLDSVRPVEPNQE